MRGLRDREMIGRIQRGEEKYLGTLIEKYYDEVYRYCFYRTGNDAAAADCTQDTFLHVIKALGSYVDKNRFRPWLFRIAANSCIDYFRKNHDICMDEEVIDRQGCEDRNLKRKEDEDLVQSALWTLSEVQREVIVLRFYHGFKIREIAAMLHITVPAAKSRMKQGMDKLRLCMKGAGADEM